jgi:hypothetical protein
MVLHPFEQPSGQGWPRFDRTRPGSTSSFPTETNTAPTSGFVQRSIGNSDLYDKRLSQPTRNELIGGTPALEKLNSSRIIGSTIPFQERRNRHWREQVERLKYNTKAELGIAPKECKPFGKFSKRNAEAEANPTTVSDKLQSPDQSRRVRFNVEVNAKDLSRSTGQRSIDTSSSTSSNGKKLAGSLALESNYSSHRCNKVKVSDFSKQNFERLFWSRAEVKQMKCDANQNAESFRLLNPAIAKQVGRLFEEVCSGGGSSSGSSTSCSSGSKSDVDDEDNEEILRAFLRDWAASEVRGLEEGVTGRNVFMETRRMGIQGVLAYQESLREQARPFGMRNTIEQTRMAELIRARSESTSQRSRMFAMYMALGDALVVSSNDAIY